MCTITVVIGIICLMQVLRLVSCLVNYGFYGSGSSLQQLMEPLMNLLDGTRDLPFPADRGNQLTGVFKYYVACGRPNRPRYGSCPSVRPSVCLFVP